MAPNPASLPSFPAQPGQAPDLPGGLPAAVAELAGAPGISDAELVRRTLAGQQDPFAALVARYQKRAFWIAFHVVGRVEDARDVAQEAFVRLYRSLGSYDFARSFYTWFYRIVMNLAIDQARKSKRQRTVDFDDALGHESEGALEGGPQGGFEDQNPRKALLRKELAERIRRALADLPEYHQAVIVLREVDGLSYEELAEVMEVPKGTIMSRLFHARRKMQEALGTYLDRDLEIED